MRILKWQNSGDASTYDVAQLPTTSDEIEVKVRKMTAHGHSVAQQQNMSSVDSKHLCVPYTGHYCVIVLILLLFISWQCVDFWTLFSGAKRLLQERKDEIENERPASTGDKWVAYEKLKRMLRRYPDNLNVKYLTTKPDEEAVNVALAHDVLVPLAGHCVLNKDHMKAYLNQVGWCEKRWKREKCWSCAGLSVAGARKDTRKNTNVRGLFIGKC